MNLHAVIDAVTDRIRKRSRDSREVYLAGIASMQVDPDSDRRSVSCSNMAHAAAAAGIDQDDVLATSSVIKPNIGIITAYNDMLSAHRPFEKFPANHQGCRAQRWGNSASCRRCSGNV
jgi:phosphogluconate dehydratase